MKVRIESKQLPRLKTECLVVPVWKGEAPEDLLNQLQADPARALFQSGDFKGKAGDTAMVNLAPDSAVARLLFVGLGEPAKLDLQQVREAYGHIAAAARQRELGTVHLLPLPVHDDSKLSTEAMVEAQITGIVLTDFRYSDFLSEPDKHALKSIVVVTGSAAETRTLKPAVERGHAYADGANTTRRLSYTPPNVATPAYLAKEAQAIGRGGSIKVTVFDEKRLLKDGFGGTMAVGQGSVNPPRGVFLEYRTSVKNAPTVVLVGKGVTFDTGGISLKPGSGMEEMKGDMAGAGSVLGVFSVLERVKPKLNVIGIVMTAENMPDGKSYRPGDIIRCYSGKTVEILNTDAEGRLLLADGLAYGEKKYKPDAILDMATLTGACVVALGHELTAIVSNHDNLTAQLITSGTATGEPAWRMPLIAPFEKMVKSKIADVRNHTNSRDAGTITAAAFLKAHLSNDTPWAHLDIAGTAWKSKNPLGEAGPTGTPVRQLLHFLENFDADMLAETDEDE